MTVLDALQATLSDEHAALYAYGVLGARTSQAAAPALYDALTAADRPYKKAMPVERALKILQEEAQSGALDSDLLHVFIEQKVYEKVAANSLPGALGAPLRQSAAQTPLTSPSQGA